MADSSFDIDYSLTDRRQRHTAPVSSRYASRSSSPLSSRHHKSSSNHATRRIRLPTPATPFARDDDMSWQGEISWQFEPSGWQDSRDLGAVLSPWTATTTPLNSKTFRRSAHDFYLSRTSGGFRGFTNPCYDFSSYSAVPSTRLVLQSFVKDNDSTLHSKEQNLGAHGKARKGKSTLKFIKGGTSSRPASPLANEDELDNYDTMEDVERQVHWSNADHHRHGHYDPHWHSVSRSYIKDDGDGVGRFDHSSISHGGRHQMRRKMDNFEDELQHRHRGHTTRQSTSYHFGGVNDRCNDIEDNDDDDDDDEGEDEQVVAKPVSLFSLYKYSTKLDILLVILGCLGALINGGSLPWYSYFFGDFVNKIANESTDQMMKDVKKV